jgi:hypothetical protein
LLMNGLPRRKLMRHHSPNPEKQSADTAPRLPT